MWMVGFLEEIKWNEKFAIVASPLLKINGALRAPKQNLWGSDGVDDMMYIDGDTFSGTFLEKKYHRDISCGEVVLVLGKEYLEGLGHLGLRDRYIHTQHIHDGAEICIGSYGDLVAMINSVFDELCRQWDLCVQSSDVSSSCNQQIYFFVMAGSSCESLDAFKRYQVRHLYAKDRPSDSEDPLFREFATDCECSIDEAVQYYNKYVLSVNQNDAVISV